MVVIKLQSKATAMYSFVESLPIKTVFLHKNQFEKQYKIQTALPAVYVATNATIKEMINKAGNNSCKNLEQLKNLVTQKLEEHVQHHHTNIQ